MTKIRWVAWMVGVASLSAFLVTLGWLELTDPVGSLTVEDLAAIALFMLPVVLLGWPTCPAARLGSASRRVVFVAGLVSWCAQARLLDGRFGILFLVSGFLGIVLVLASRINLPADDRSSI